MSDNAKATRRFRFDSDVSLERDGLGGDYTLKAGTSIAFKARECMDCGTPENRDPKADIVVDIYLTRMGKKFLCFGCLSARRSRGEKVTRSSIS